MGEQTGTGLPVATVVAGRYGGLRPLYAQSDAWCFTVYRMT